MHKLTPIKRSIEADENIKHFYMTIGRGSPAVFEVRCERCKQGCENPYERYCKDCGWPTEMVQVGTLRRKLLSDNGKELEVNGQRQIVYQ